MPKKKATPKGSPKQSQHNSNSTHHQRQRLLDGLRHAGPSGLSTIELREQHDIMMPAARVHELRHRQGLNIHTVWDRECNAQGNEHPCGRYILFPGKWEGAA